MKGRLATQRILAEREQGVITDEIDKELMPLIRRIYMNSENPPKGRPSSLTLPVGPVLTDSRGNPLQMAMALTPSYVPAAPVDMMLRDGVGIMPGSGGTLSAISGNSSPLARGIEFGWTPPQGLPGVLDYRQSKDPEILKQSRDIDYKTLLRDTQVELMQRGGLRSGDLLHNTPEGQADGDYRRARAYMLNGYGMPDAGDGSMYAQIRSDGGLSPVQIYSPDPSMMKALNWTINNEAIQRAQRQMPSPF